MSIACQTTFLGIALTSSLNPSLLGQNVDFTATTTLAGTMTFYDGASVLGTAAIAGGVAVFSTNALSSGQHSITAKTGSLVSNIVIQVVTGGGPPFGPLQLDAATLAIVNNAMDFLFACNGVPPVRHLTGIMNYDAPTTRWFEYTQPTADPSLYNQIEVTSVTSELIITIDVGATIAAYHASLSAFPIGVATFNFGGAIITGCGNVPNLPFAGPGAVSWA